MKMPSSLYYSFYIWLSLIAGRDTALPVKYKGCMIARGANDFNATDSSRRGSFGHSARLTYPNSINHCVERCFASRYHYAAMQGGKYCYCGTTTNGLDMRTDDFCYERCPGNCRQRCGGLVTMSVYTTEYVKEPTDLWYNRQFRKIPNLIKCFKIEALPSLCTEQKSKPVLKTSRMSAVMCSVYCHSGSKAEMLPIAVVKAKDECCCGSNKDRALRVPNSVPVKTYCSQPCEGIELDSWCVGRRVNQDGSTDLYISMYDVITNDNFELKDGIYQAQMDSRQTYSEPEEEEGTQTDQEEKKLFGLDKTKRTIIIVVSLAVVLLVCSTSVFTYQKRKKKKTVESSNARTKGKSASGRKPDLPSEGSSGELDSLLTTPARRKTASAYRSRTRTQTRA